MNTYSSRLMTDSGCGSNAVRLFSRSSLLYERRHVEDQSHFPVAENAGSADAIGLPEQLAQWLDDCLEFPEQRVDNESRPLSGVLHDDDTLTARRRLACTEYVAQSYEGQHRAAQIGEVVVRFRGEFDAFLDAVERQYEAGLAHRDLKAIDDG